MDTFVSIVPLLITAMENSLFHDVARNVGMMKVLRQEQLLINVNFSY